MIWCPLDGPRAGSPTLRAYLSGRPVGVAGAERSFPDRDTFVARGRERLGFLPEPGLVSSMRELLERHDAPGASFDSLAAIAGGERVVVCTGQQPAIAGGPLYTLHKAATAVAAARVLSDAGVPASAAFWIASDDADVHEAGTAYAPGSDRGLEKATIEGSVPEGTMVGDLPIERSSAAVDALFGDTGWADPETVRRMRAASDLGDGLASLLLSFFGADGLVVVDSRMPGARRAAEPVLATYIERAAEVAEVVRRSGAAIEADGGKRAIHEKSADSALFAVGEDGLRRKLDDPAEARTIDPLRWSAGVAIRPFVQEAILPSAGFVTGPGELAYLLETEAAVPMLDVPRSTFVPRLGLTWIDAPLAALVDEAGAGETAWRDLLARATEFQDAALRRRLPTALVDPLAAVRSAVDDGLRVLDTASAEHDPNLAAVVESARRKIDFQLSRVDEQMMNGARKRARTDGTELANVTAVLYPRKGLQERTLSMLWPLVSATATDVAARAIDAAAEFLERAWSGRAAHAATTLVGDPPAIDCSEETWIESSESA